MVGTSYKKDNSCSTKGSLFIHAFYDLVKMTCMYIYKDFGGKLPQYFFHKI